MTLQLTTEEKAVFNAVKYLPAISVIIPFESKISLKTELEYHLKQAVKTVQDKLIADYPAEKALPVLHKLMHLIKNLNYNAYKKSIAIFVSPMVEKVFYLDIAVEEKIVIDDSFEIRDLVLQKKQAVQYLILILSAKKSTMFLGNGTALQLIKSNLAETTHIPDKDFPERVSNFSDPENRAQVLLNKFLHQVDEGLTSMLKAYQLPVFVMGAGKVLGYFKKLTKNGKNVLQYIHGNYEDVSEQEIHDVLQPHLKDWHKVKELDLLHQLEKAMDAKKVACGIKDVWCAAAHKNCRLLVVEKGFRYTARQGADPDIIYADNQGTEYPFYIKDAVDDIMQKVLESGADVEFTDNDVLKEYGHIALIQYY